MRVTFDFDLNKFNMPCYTYLVFYELLNYIYDRLAKRRLQRSTKIITR